MKKHWTQTASGRAKMASTKKAYWARRHQVDAAVTRVKVRREKIAARSDGSISQKLKSADSIEQLNEVKAFLDLRDELIARLG